METKSHSGVPSPFTPGETVLELRGGVVRYGGVTALDGASIHVREGEVVALMGPNGAGKSTALKALFGIAPLVSGEVLWRGHKIVPHPHEMAARGAAFVPQGRRVFKDLSVRENIELGGWTLPGGEVQERLNETLELFPGLKQKLREKAGSLSGGQQQMVAIARALMIDPKALLLDEPSLGLSPKAVTEVFEKIAEISARRKAAIAVVEHNVASLLKIATRAYVLDKGTIAAEGEPFELLKSGVFEKVFLGRVA